jgi:hypothetical protein
VPEARWKRPMISIVPSGQDDIIDDHTSL